jgi:hypothetical protein
MNVKLHEEMEIGEPYSNFTITVDNLEMQLRRFSDGTEEYFEIFNKESNDWDFDISPELLEEIEMLF